MMRLIKWILCLGLLAAAGRDAGAFSLLGKFKNGANGAPIPWQGDGFGGRPQGLGYELDFDIGGPMSLLEGYRWNVPIITYAFDSTFLRYFGSNGVNAVEEAFQILNDLPAASKMTASLTEFPMDAKDGNATAETLGLLDLKSYTLAMLLEQLGLANPERFAWTLRDRRTGTIGNVGYTNYSVIQLNYDPVTLEETPFVNGVRYSYRIFDDLGPVGNEWASAVEWYRLDPLYQPHSSVAGGLGSEDGFLGASPDLTSFSGSFGSGLGIGQYFRGLTRDDAGGLRFLLSTNNFVVESLLPDVFPSAKFAVGGSPWAPFPAFTNVVGTNVTGVTNVVGGGTNLTNFVRLALRPGRDKLEFRRVAFDALLGSTFTMITNRYFDKYINPTNSRVTSQRLERVFFQPDIVFAVGDLGTDGIAATPFLIARRDTTGWSNNVAANTAFPGLTSLGGPGVITAGAFLLYSDLVPYWVNDVPGDLEGDPLNPLVNKSPLWGSFDGTTKPPVVYPAFPHPLQPNLSIAYLQSLALQPRN